MPSHRVVPPGEGARRQARIASSGVVSRDWWQAECSPGRLEDTYEIGRVIGRGAYSAVMEGIDRTTRERYAVKTVKLKPSKRGDERSMIKKRDKVLAEAYLTWICDHDNILAMREFFVQSDRVTLVLELMRGGSLFDSILESGGFTEGEIRLIARQLCTGELPWALRWRWPRGHGVRQRFTTGRLRVSTQPSTTCTSGTSCTGTSSSRISCWSGPTGWTASRSPTWASPSA